MGLCSQHDSQLWQHLRVISVQTSIVICGDLAAVVKVWRYTGIIPQATTRGAEDGTGIDRAGMFDSLPAPHVAQIEREYDVNLETF